MGYNCDFRRGIGFPMPQPKSIRLIQMNSKVTKQTLINLEWTVGVPI